MVSSLLAAMAVPALAGEKKKVKKEAFTDPAKAGPDFAVQGEYVGTFEMEGTPIKWGGQIIALGDGKFRAVGYPGGLPGDGWVGGKKLTTEGATSNGDTVFMSPDGDAVATLADGKFTVKDPAGRLLGTLGKVERKSPTLGEKPPKGAVVLFDGTSAEGFEGGRMTDDGLLMEGCASKPLFQSFTLHIEFRLPFQPHARGQGRGNSGFYAQGRYEVQMLDSFGLEGETNECGGIYKVARPKVNMCLPPLSWQTYDVDFTAAEFQNGKKVKNARMTVRHNGVLIHENVEIPHTTVGARLREEGPEPGPIYLQNHGNPVRYRNIWVVKKE
jgi:hypothetical protein